MRKRAKKQGKRGVTMRKRAKQQGRSLRKRYGRSAIPMKVHGQLFMEPESVLEAAREAQAEILEAEMPAEIALEEMPPTLAGEAFPATMGAPAMYPEPYATEPYAGIQDVGHSWSGEPRRHSKAAKLGHKNFRKEHGVDYGRGGKAKKY